MPARAHTAPGEMASQQQQQQPAFYTPIHSVAELEQHLNALSRERGYYSYSDVPPPLTRGTSAASSDSGGPSRAQTPAEYLGQMATAAYKTSGPDASAILNMLQMGRASSGASTSSAYSDAGSSTDRAGQDKVAPAGDVAQDPDEQIFDFSEFFEGFSVSE